MRALFVAALLLLTLAPIAAPEAAATRCVEVGPGTPPAYVTVRGDCVAHCPVLQEVYPDVYELHPECLGP